MPTTMKKPSTTARGVPDAQIIKLDQLAELADRTLNKATPTLTLAALIDKKFVIAREHKMQAHIVSDLLKSLRQRKGQYDPADKALLGGIDIFMQITGLKCRGFESWLRDTMVNVQEKPWTITASPIPELNEDETKNVVEQLKAEIEASGFEVDIDQITERAKELKTLLRRNINAQAEAAAVAMEKTIADQMTHGDWRTAWFGFISDLATYQNAILKGPVVKMKRKLKWVRNKIQVMTEPTLTVERVNPFYLFPSPDSTTAHDGEFIIEIKPMGRRDLMDAMDLSGFSREAIEAALEDYGDGYEIDGLYDEEQQDLEERDEDRVSNNFYIQKYYGTLLGEELTNLGIKQVDDDKGYADYKPYEMEVWVLGDYVLYASMNPHPLGKRPFHTSAFVEIPGSFWGESLPDVIRDIQRVANSSARSLVRNMAFTSGPIGEVDLDRLADEEAPDEITPYKLYFVNADPAMGGHKAFTFTNIPSNATELMGVYQAFAQQADDHSGIPAYVYGNPNVAGAGRTLGGLSLLYGNAAKGLKEIIGRVDISVIEPLVSDFYLWNMLYNEDESIKADAQVMVRGSVGILQRELAEANRTQALQILDRYLQLMPDLVSQEGVAEVLKPVLETLGIDPSAVIKDTQRQAQVESIVTGQPAQQSRTPLPGGAPPPGAGQQTTQPGTPSPPLDGRSQAAVDVQNSAQLTAEQATDGQQP